MRTLGLTVSVVISLAGCGDDGASEGSTDPSITGATSGAGAGATAIEAGSGAAGGGSGGMAGRGGSSVPPPVSGTNAPPAGGMPAAQPADEGGSRATAGTGAAGVAGGAGMPSEATGPKDGDPSTPIVAIDGIACGGSGPGSNYEIGGRELTVDYPCNKHEGAHVTVILNLHGTLIGGASYLYQRAYFSAHRFVDSHNLIVLTPRSVSRATLGAQWGNMDNGEDVPHLLEVIDWAYTTFARFQIRGLWVGGHSWGARFISGTMHPVGEAFACHPMLEDRMKGAIGMSHLRTPIACAGRLSLISTRGEEEELPLADQSSVAMEHGCMTPMKGPEQIGNNNYRYFEGCDSGWVHEDYEMLGKGHIDSMDQEVVKKILDAIKSTEES